MTLTWTAPGNDGGLAITSYEYCQKENSGETCVDANWASAGTGLSYAVTGLVNGREYFFRLRAVNAVGDGAESSEPICHSGHDSGGSCHCVV